MLQRRVRLAALAGVFLAGLLVVSLVASKRGLTLPPHHNSELPLTFEVWDRVPVSEHLLLYFLHEGDFENRRAYQNASPWWLLFLYSYLKPFTLLGIPYRIAQHAVALVTFACMLLLLYTQLDALEREPVRLDRLDYVLPTALAILALYCVVTLPSFWVASLIANPVSQTRFGAPLAFAYFSAIDYRNEVFRRIGFLIALAVVLVAPFYTLFIVTALVILGGVDPVRPLPGGLKIRHLRRLVIVLTATGTATFFLPLLLAKLGGFTAAGSGFAFRSGLDGSQQYFSSMLQAILHPALPASRRWHLLPFPVAAATMAAGMFLLSRPLGEKMLRQLLVCLTPALLTVAVLPQVVAIHPYQYDFGLTFGPAFCLAFWLADPQIRRVLESRRALMLLLFIILIALLITNGLDLARALR